ncbi:helicase associated domain-containing protein [Streptomyces sp. NPDC005078]|uniref:helicase associated domain-containing protein n=1 Tax=unclassified Streptomyces TaxID=2593676 RepID=UPI0033BB9CBC
MKAARQFHQREGHLKVQLGHREILQGDDVLLGRWIRKCRTNTAQLTASQIIALTALGIELEPLFQEAVFDVADTLEDDTWWTAPELPWVSPTRLFPR